MSDYSQITFFTPKDGLATGNPNKIIYGSDVDAELSAISTAIASKADVDGDAIGAGTPATELSVDNLKLDANKIISTNTDGDIELEPNGAGYVVITNVDVAAGEIDGTTIGANSAAAGTFTTANATTVDTTNLEVTNLKAKDGTAAGSIANTTGVVTLASSVLTTTDINGGTIDGAIIGGATPAAITGTTLTANTSLALASGATVTAILDEDAMTSNSATALATQQSIKAYVDAQVTAQDLDVTTDSGTIAIDLDSETLTVAGGTGLDTSATGNTVTVAIDSTVATLTGAQTLTNKVLTSPDINTPDIDGGNIDGTVIGAATPAAGTFTNLTATGTTTLAGASTTADITFGDNDKAIFGAGSDLQIYHDGSNSFIKENGTGNLDIYADNLLIRDSAGTEVKAYFDTNGEVGLRYDGATKLATTSSGIDVTGTVTADGLTVDANSTTGAVKIQSGDNNTFGAGRAQLALSYNATDDYQHFVRTSHDIVSSGNKVELLICDGTQNNTVSSGSTRVATFAGNGDISFYEDTGTTPKFFWDASAERLGLGTSSPSASIHAYHPTTNVVGTFESGDADVYITLADSTTTSDTAMRIGVTGNDMHFSTSATERMRITSAGNVGIGTSSPIRLLDVYSNSAQSDLAITASTTGQSFLAFADTADGNVGAIAYDHATDHMRFRVNDAERMRIDSSGNLAINTTSTGGFKTRINAFGSSDSGLVIGGLTNQQMLKLDSQQSQTGSNGVVFYRNGSFIGNITWDSVDVDYNTTSDARLKENITDAEDAGAKVDAIQVRQFDWKADGSHRDYGMIAQELMTVVPEAVNGDPESDDMMGVDYSKLVPMLVKEIQSLRARVAQLEGA